MIFHCNGTFLSLWVLIRLYIRVNQCQLLAFLLFSKCFFVIQRFTGGTWLIKRKAPFSSWNILYEDFISIYTMVWVNTQLWLAGGCRSIYTRWFTPRKEIAFKLSDNRNKWLRWLKLVTMAMENQLNRDSAIKIIRKRSVDFDSLKQNFPPSSEDKVVHWPSEMILLNHVTLSCHLTSLHLSTPAVESLWRRRH